MVGSESMYLSYSSKLARNASHEGNHHELSGVGK